MIELNKPYKAKELAVALGVSERTFRGRRQELEEYFTQNYEWNMEKIGRSNIYTFTSYYGSGQSFKHIRSNAAQSETSKRELNTRSRIDYFKECVWRELCTHPYNTKTNMVNKFWLSEEWGYNTIKKYVNLAIEELQNECQLYISDNATLCIYDGDNYIYTKLDNIHKNEYYWIWKKEFERTGKKIAAYKYAQKECEEKYGYQLQWVHKMELSAWRNDND